MRLRPNELCPIHRSFSCCGREILPKPRLIKLGVQRVEDSHHPRGYWELRSPAEMRKLLKPQGAPNKPEYAQFATRRLPTITTSFRTTRIRKDGRSLEGRPPEQFPGNTLGGAMRKRVNKNGLTYGRSHLFAPIDLMNPRFAA